jgi:hypothetical protein
MEGDHPKETHDKKLSPNQWAAVIILGILIVWLIWPSSESKKEEVASPPPTTSPKSSSPLADFDDSKIISAVSDLQKAGLITKISLSSSEAQVDRYLWNITPLDTKKTIAAVVTEYVRRIGRDKSPHLYFIDDHSGKELASFSFAFGFDSKE